MSAKRTAENKWANATIQDNFIFSKTMELYLTCVANFSN